MVVVLAGQSRIGISTVNLELGKVCIRGQTNRVVIGKKGKVGRASACCVKVGRHCADRHSPTPVLIRVLATRRRVAAVGGVGGRWWRWRRRGRSRYHPPPVVASVVTLRATLPLSRQSRDGRLANQSPTSSPLRRLYGRLSLCPLLYFQFSTATGSSSSSSPSVTHWVVM